ncbi:MAG: hypothetical protein HY000_03280 [Planctomycetes bacterium]|nr:hypothetical protein [Planctomycetota bacterium]
MSTNTVMSGPGSGAPDGNPQSEHFERPTGFGRVRWWFEESPMAVTASIALTLVTIGFFWILTVRSLRADMPVASVSLQAVQADSIAKDAASAPESAMEIERLAASQGNPVERVEEKIDLPVVPPTDTRIKPPELLGNQADSDKQLKETDAALREASEALRKLLDSNQTRGQGRNQGTGAAGAGQLDPETTPGRQARWVITYPTLPQGAYEAMLDFFKIELAFLQADRKTMQYVGRLSGAGRKYTGDVSNENRMFWFWMGQNHLRELDDLILQKHGLVAASEVVHLYPKELEQRLAKLEKDYLARQFKQSKIDLIAQTSFKMLGDGGGWHLEVTGMQLK